MAKRLLSHVPEKRDRIITLVAQWKARPPALRQPKSLHQLAQQNNITPNADFYALANGPEVLMKVVTQIAGAALDDSAEVLEVLAGQAKKGHTRSAEIYLEWVRKVVTDASIMEYVKPAADMSQTLQQISDGAKEMLAVARQLKGDSDIDRYLQSNAEPAEYTDLHDPTPARLSQASQQQTPTDPHTDPTPQRE